MILTRRGCLHPTYELRDGDAFLGSIQARSGWKFEAVAQMRDRTVAFRQPSWWNRDFEAVDERDGSVMATYDMSTWRMSDTVAIGDRRFTVRRSPWKSSAKITDQTGAEVLAIRSIDWLGRKQDVTLSPGVAFDEDIELLVYFVCFALALAESDSSSAAVVAAVTT